MEIKTDEDFGVEEKEESGLALRFLAEATRPALAPSLNVGRKGRGVRCRHMEVRLGVELGHVKLEILVGQLNTVEP